MTISDAIQELSKAIGQYIEVIIPMIGFAISVQFIRYAMGKYITAERDYLQEKKDKEPKETPVELHPTEKPVSLENSRNLRSFHRKRERDGW